MKSDPFFSLPCRVGATSQLGVALTLRLGGICPRQELAALLQRLKAGGHKALIFTQMTRMLDILEAFLNLHAHTYLRLDGSTKPEARQASTRAQGVEVVRSRGFCAQVPAPRRCGR